MQVQLRQGPSNYVEASDDDWDDWRNLLKGYRSWDDLRADLGWLAEGADTSAAALKDKGLEVLYMFDPDEYSEQQSKELDGQILATYTPPPSPSSARP